SATGRQTIRWSICHGIRWSTSPKCSLDGVDPRQVAEMFKVLRDYVSPLRQYIITINQNHLDEIVPYLTTDEYNTIITNNICHELHDDSPAGKLLGIQLDMQYD
ncbi:DUF2326 domain-containing protein, partial [Dyadobacter bucti]|uniref:DUF2326 domain-containing protein n=1 Tax=Dyadobacter bucti TaxID=2572203 RepID=UPI003F71C917